MRVEIFMPSTSPAIKRANIERFGADVTVIDGYYDDAQREVEKRQAETGALMVHPYDHAETVAGQGTMAKELEEQLGEFDTLVVANGGGGFVAGQAAWFRDRVRIVSVEPELSQCLRPALLAGERVPVTVGGIAADSLGAQLGEIPWAISRHFVDEAVLVSDDDIRAAQQRALDRPAAGGRARRCGRLRGVDDGRRETSGRRADGRRGLWQQLRPDQR